MDTPKRNGSPFQGLNPYTAAEAEYFFGRDRERTSIIANLLAERLTLLYGASGVGKTSVLRAGVEHHLNMLARQNVEKFGRPEFVVAVFKEWSEPDLMPKLVATVETAVSGFVAPEKPTPPKDNFATTLLGWAKQLNGHLLIIFDQFEDYFLYHKNEEGPGTFAEEFPDAINTVGLPANFLVSFREDAFAKLAFFEEMLPDVFGNYLELTHLNRNAGQNAISGPIETYNVKYANAGPRMEVEQALVEAVLDQVRIGKIPFGDLGRGALKDEPAELRIEATFLQMVMERLWDEEHRAKSQILRLATLDALADKDENGSQRIVRTHLDSSMERLRVSQKEIDIKDIAADVFHHLVTPGGTKIAHTVADLAEYAEHDEAHVAPLLAELASSDMRILRGAPPNDQGEPRYEIYHDVLAQPILDWRRRRMKAREQAAAQQQAHLQARAEEQARTVRLKRAGIGVLALLLVVAVVLLVWALRQQAAANKSAQAAIENQKKAEAERAKSEIAQKEAEDQRIKADDLAEKYRTAQEFAEEQRTLAQNNEKIAKREKSQAVRLASSEKDLSAKMQKAEGDYRFAQRESRNECDKRPLLESNLQTWAEIKSGYETLKDKARAAAIAKRIEEITAEHDAIICARPD